MQSSASSVDATNANIVTQTQAIGPTVKENTNGLAAAVARALARGAAVYFSRPVRLFRPTKVSGWTSLRGAALRDGASLTPKYILNLIKSEGFVILPRHFVPPLVVNTLLGTVLWSSYSYSSTYLESVIPTHPIVAAATSGALAGATQALAAAPAENVRLVLEGAEGAGPVKTLLGHAAPHPRASAGWTHAWREVFRGRDPIVHAQSREELRAVAQWMREVRGMAGRGWDGWGWGIGKDSAGFALFFSIFELSRKLANDASGRVVSEFARWHIRLDKDATPMTEKAKKTAARTVHGVTLVAGGVVAGLGYEMVCRPFDNTRKLVYLDDQHKKAESISAQTKRIRPEARIHVVGRVVLAKLNEDGPASFFQNPQPTSHASTGPNTWLYAGLRTLSRLGPWGVGFLVWEFMGGGLPQI